MLRSMQKYKRTLILLGNRSLVVTMPWQISEELRLTKGGNVFVSLSDDGRTIIIHQMDTEQG